MRLVLVMGSVEAPIECSVDPVEFTKDSLSRVAKLFGKMKVIGKTPNDAVIRLLKEMDRELKFTSRDVDDWLKTLDEKDSEEPTDHEENSIQEG